MNTLSNASGLTRPRNRPTFVVIGADKGGVGKTTVTRTFIDYLASNGCAVRAIDTEWPRGGLKRFYPHLTDVVDITQVHDQIKVFDEENPVGRVTVIDVRAGLLSKMLETLRDIGFLEFANQGHFNLVVLHILGPTIASLDEIIDAGKIVGSGNYILVKNFINDTTFFEWQLETYNRYVNAINGAKEMVVPKLNGLACENVELAHVPYTQFIADRDANGEVAAYSFVLRGYVRHWLTQVWAGYDRLGLAERLIVADTPTEPEDRPALP